MCLIRNCRIGGNNNCSRKINFSKVIGIVKEILFSNVNYRVNLR